jgi:hypothetical protein
VIGEKNLDLFTIQKTQDDTQFLQDIFKAYFDARKNKRNKKASLDFEYNFESKVIQLYKNIVDKTYKPLPSIAFT